MSRSLRPIERANRIAWFFDRTREPLLRPIQCKFCAEKTKQPRGDCWAESLSGQWVCPACSPQAPDRLGEGGIVECSDPGIVFEGCRHVGGRFVDGVFEADGDAPLATSTTKADTTGKRVGIWGLLRRAARMIWS